jgi:hypothetical protein
MRELERQGNAIEARQATAVATLVTLVTITKENPRATGRSDNGDRYRKKNKDKKQWRFGGESADWRLDPTGDSMITPCVGHHYRGKDPTQWRWSRTKNYGVPASLLIAVHKRTEKLIECYPTFKIYL